jgi:hypothetical protein
MQSSGFLSSENAEYIQSSSSANGSAEWPPDDRLRRTIQYSRGSSDGIERPRRTGYPHARGMTTLVQLRYPFVIASQRVARMRAR